MDEDEEIRKLQMERKKATGISLSAALSGGYDDLYGAGGGSLTYIDEDDLQSRTQDKKSFVNSFAGGRHLADLEPEDDNFDPMKEGRKLSVGEKENEYRARWRKRKLSPPRVDHFAIATGKKKKDSAVGATTYKDAMLDTQLDKERQDLVFKIQDKMKKEEQDRIKGDMKKSRELRKQEKKEKRERKEKKSKWDEGDEGRSSSSSSRKKEKKEWDEGEDEDEESKSWRVRILKNGAKLQDIFVEEDITYSLGRGDENDIKLEHGSCSKNHARLAFVTGKLSVMDLGSTNGTFLNEKQLKPNEWTRLRDKDKIKFGCSTRDYEVIAPDL
ncbi:hypothetical protein PROFUN_08927 [Planoprotostelium fungivorum]|uniref:FHA domain-containing protein n=1 Tax=Planoprotostelium fungivorum TaxID=1890364 RepID=A0A2P6NIP7_9EUKA|nr:hypothetical protein PROFUN_08927 [Planoprotostelium fungivorum]